MPDIKHIYTQSLENTHAAEAQALQQIELQLPGLTDYPDYAALIGGHAEAIKARLGRIEAALADVGASAPTAREAVTRTVGAAGAAVHAVMPDTTLKNLFAGSAFQGEMIAAYSALGVIADAAGEAGHAGWIGDALAQHKDAAAKVQDIIGPVTRRFLASHTS